MVQPRYMLTMESLGSDLLVFGGYGGSSLTMEKLVEGEWIKEHTQYQHGSHVSVSLLCVAGI